MRTFGHKRKLRDATGQVVGEKPSPPSAITREKYAVLYPKARKIIVTLEAGDVLAFREHGRRHRWLLAVDTAFRYAVRCQANAEAAMKRKTKKKKGQ